MAGVTNVPMDRTWIEILAAPDTVSLQAIGSPVELVVSAAEPALTVASFYLSPAEGVRTFAAGDNLWARGATGSKLRVATDLTEGGSSGGGGGGDASEAEQQAQTAELQGINTKIAATNALLTTQATFLDGPEGLLGTLAARQVAVVKPAIVVDATTNYADGDTVGGLITLTNFARIATGSGLIIGFQLRSLINITVQSFLHVFDANPAASTFTDNAAMVLDAADRAKRLRTFAIPAGAWATPKGVAPNYAVDLIGGIADHDKLPYGPLASGRDLFLAIEADGAIDFTSTADITAVIAHLQD